jgi:DNA-binding response OmpR family regulator
MSEQEPAKKIVVMIRDLFFSVKVKNELTNAGYEPLLVKREPELLSTVEASSPVLVVLDLNAKPDWKTLEPLLSDDAGPPVLAFGPHKDVEARKTAQAAGVTRVVTNQQFHKNLHQYIETYSSDPS